MNLPFLSTVDEHEICCFFAGSYYALFSCMSCIGIIERLDNKIIYGQIELRLKGCYRAGLLYIMFLIRRMSRSTDIPGLLMFWITRMHPFTDVGGGGGGKPQEGVIIQSGAPSNVETP